MCTADFKTKLKQLFDGEEVCVSLQTVSLSDDSREERDVKGEQTKRIQVAWEDTPNACDLLRVTQLHHLSLSPICC